MITSLVIKSANDSFGSSLTLDDAVFNLHKFEWSYPTRGPETGKMQAPGQHDQMFYVSKMPIDMEGDLVQDTTANYWTSRKALMAKVIPLPTNTTYNPVRFELVVDGDATTYYALCRLVQNVGALESTGAPTVSAFMLGFDCPFGYWRKVSDDSVVLL